MLSNPAPLGSWRSCPKPARHPTLPPGGEAEGRRRLSSWLESGLGRYSESRDDLAADATSRLSPYLHFGCVSPLEVVESAAARASSEEFVRQLCWRDFNHQLLAARPEIARQDLRPRGDRWRDAETDLIAWKEGRTGYPLVDAGMRQLLEEGFMHNRARLVTASFLTKHLYLDWRLGRRSLRIPPRGRRPREQHRELAVGGRDRGGHSPQPHVQSDTSGAAVRPERRVRPPLRV